MWMQPATKIRPYRRQYGAQFEKLYLAVNKRGLPVKFIVTEGTRANCKEAIDLLKNLDAKLLLADKAYDSNEVLSYIAKRNIKSKRNKLEQRDFKGFKVLKKRDNSLIVNFIALDILSRILSLLLSVGMLPSLVMLKLLITLCFLSLLCFLCESYLI